MGIISLWPLAFLITIPLVVLLYILKRKYKEVEISSSFLWKEAYKNTKADTPWEKLKINIMMILQIIILLLIIFALLNPFLKFGGKSYKNLIVVMDVTASMSTLYDEDKTRLDKGKEEVKDYIKSIKEKTETYIVSFKDNSDFQTEKSIEDVKQGYGSGDIENCLSYVKSLSENLEEAEILLVTDKNVDLGDINGKVICLANSGKNASITNLSHKISEDNIKVIASIKNTGIEDYSGDFSLYDEDKLMEVKSISLGKGESITLDFTMDNSDCKYLKGELSSKDLIEGDNVYYDVINKDNIKKVLLVTEKNIFLERSLNNIANIELYKTNDASNIGNEEYDLYVFDNIMPDVMPSTGNILFLNPSSNEFFSVEGKEEVKSISGNSEELSNYLKDINFTVSKYKKINMPYYGKTLLKNDDNETIAFIGENEGRVISALGFNIHDSDLGLKKEFPLLIYDLSESIINSGILSKNNYNGGETVNIRIQNIDSKIKIRRPDNSLEDFYYGDKVDTIKQLGLYSIIQENEKNEDLFSINFPNNESDISIENENSINNSKDNVKSLKHNLSLVPLLLVLVIGALLTEWILYLKGN